MAAATAKPDRSKTTLLQKLSLGFFHRPTKTAIIWLVVAIMGAASYATLLKREGFPPVASPFALSGGSYLVNDASLVDREIAKPLSQFLLKQDGVKSVQTQSFSNFYSVIVNYEERVDSRQRTAELSKAVTQKQLLPAKATFEIKPYEFGFTPRGDEIVISIFSKSGQPSIEQLVDQAKSTAKFINEQNLPLVKDASILNPLELATNPITGETAINQKSFDRYGIRQDEQNNFFNSVVVGVDAEVGADNLVAGLGKSERLQQTIRAV